MVKKKNAAVVIGRYYHTLPVVMGLYHLFDWELTVLDVGFDPSNVGQEHFYRELPESVKRFRFTNDKSLFRHFADGEYDMVFATHVKHSGVNAARVKGIITNLYIIIGAFLKPGVIPATKTNGELTERKQNWGSLVTKLLTPGSYINFIKGKWQQIMKPGPVVVNHTDAYDRVFCWNRAEAKYYAGKKQLITPHPFHLYLASLASNSAFSGNILIAHNCDPDYYTPGYNELIQAVINRFATTCSIALKVHPLAKEIPSFTGAYKQISHILSESEASTYDIFLNEDSYMAVEMYFRGKYCINYGVLDEAASNIEFTHVWSNNSDRILDIIAEVINDWDTVNAQQVTHLRQYFNTYTPPEEWGPLCPRNQVNTTITD